MPVLLALEERKQDRQNLIGLLFDLPKSLSRIEPNTRFRVVQGFAQCTSSGMSGRSHLSEDASGITAERPGIVFERIREYAHRDARLFSYLPKCIGRNDADHDEFIAGRLLDLG